MRWISVACAFACALLMMGAPAFTQTLYTVKVWDPRFPGRDPIQITTTVNAAAALVQAGVAAPVDNTLAGYLANYALGTAPPAYSPSLDFSDARNSMYIF